MNRSCRRCYKPVAKGPMCMSCSAKIRNSKKQWAPRRFLKSYDGLSNLNKVIIAEKFRFIINND